MKTVMLVFAGVLLILGAAPAGAAVVATVDRSNVELNESFTLKLTVDSDLKTEPDVSGLEKDFYVGTRSTMNNTTIINGEVSRTVIWSYVLMARRDGSLAIPPIKVGVQQSNSLTITVMPQSTAAPGEADIFITAEVDHPTSYVSSVLSQRRAVLNVDSDTHASLSVASCQR